MNRSPSSSASAFEDELLPHQRATLRDAIAAYGITGDWAAVPEVRRLFEVLAVERQRVGLRAEGMTDEKALLTACSRLAVEAKTHESRRYRAQCAWSQQRSA